MHRISQQQARRRLASNRRAAHVATRVARRGLTNPIAYLSTSSSPPAKRHTDCCSAADDVSVVRTRDDLNPIMHPIHGMRPHAVLGLAWYWRDTIIRMENGRRAGRPDEHPCIGACGLAFSSPPAARSSTSAWRYLEYDLTPSRAPPLETHASMRSASSIFCAVVRCGLATLCS